MNTCPECGSSAYIGLVNIECSNSNCRHFTISACQEFVAEHVRKNFAHRKVAGGQCLDYQPSFRRFYSGTSTGRFSSKEPNMARMPGADRKDDVDDEEIERLLIDPGYSDIELRLLATYCEAWPKALELKSRVNANQDEFPKINIDFIVEKKKDK